MVFGNKKTLLLVEDEAILALYEQQNLEQFGYQVRTALSGEDAIVACMEHVEIDLILMDIDLGPGIDGTEAAAKILALTDIPIVFLSSHTETEIVEKTERITSYGYVVKNTGITVLDTSIKMAFKLFDEKRNVSKKQQALETAYEVMESTNKELAQTVELLKESQQETSRTLMSLRATTSKLEAVFESMTDAVFISDVDGNFINFNEAFATYHRFKDKKECYKQLSQYHEYIDVFFDDRTLAPLDMWAVPRALRGERVSNAEYMLMRKDTGETWWGSYSFGPIRDATGEIIGSVVIGREITERKRLEEERRIARLKYQTLFEHFPMGITIANTEGQILESNLMAEQLLGLGVEKQSQRTIDGEEWSIVRPDGTPMPPNEFASVRAISERQLVKNVEMGIVKGRHEITWISVTAAPLEGIGVAICYGDISDKKRVLDDLHSVNESLVRTMDKLESNNEELAQTNELLEKSQEVLNQNLALLGEERARLRATLFAIPLAVLIADTNGRIIESNEQAKSIWGDGFLYTENMYDFDLFTQWWPQSGLALKLDDWAITRAIKNGETVIGQEVIIRGLDGETRNISNNAAPIRDDQGRIIGGVVVVKDITERVYMVEELRRSELDLAEAQRVAKIGNWRFILHTGEIRWSDELFNVFDVEKGQFDRTYQAFLSSVHHDDKQRVVDMNRSALETGKTFEIYYRIITRHHEVRHIREIGYPIKNDAGEIIGLFGTAQDVTTITRMTEELIESRIRFDAAIRALNIGLWDWNLRDNSIRFSPEWKQIIGYENHEIADDYEELLSRIHPDDRDRSLDTINRFLQNPWPDYELEYRFRHKDGTYRWFLAKAALIFDEDSKPIRLLGSHIDITHLKKTEESVRELERQLIDISEQERRLIGSEIHDDLGQKLTYANLLFDIIKKEIIPPRFKQHKDVISMKRLLGEIIDQTRALAYGLNPVRLEQGGFLAALEDLAVETARITGIDVPLAVTGTISIGDNTVATNLYYIIKEAVTNAIKHAKGNGLAIEIAGDTTWITTRVINRIASDAKRSVGAKSGLGLSHMQYRAHTIGAYLNILQAADRFEVIVELRNNN